MFSSLTYMLHLFFTTKQQHGVTFSNDDQRRAALATLAQERSAVEINNILYNAGESDHVESINKFSHIPGFYNFLNFSTPSLNLNFFFSSSETEFLDIFTGFVKPRVARRRRDFPPECSDLPSYKNWLVEGKTTPVQYQAPCSNSFIQASLSTLESAIAIENEFSPVKLSVQNVLECVKNITGVATSGCNGGDPLSIWEYARNNRGLVLESSYNPYTGDPSGNCVNNLPRMPESEVDFWSQLPDEESMKCRVALHGPILAAMKIKGTFMRRYKSGIWTDTKKVCSSVNDNNLDHSVMIIGE